MRAHAHDACIRRVWPRGRHAPEPCLGVPAATCPVDGRLCASHARQVARAGGAVRWDRDVTPTPPKGA